MLEVLDVVQLLIREVPILIFGTLTLTLKWEMEITNYLIIAVSNVQYVQYNGFLAGLQYTYSHTTVQYDQWALTRSCHR